MLFVVYAIFHSANPTEVHFTNYSNNEIMHFLEGEKREVECMAMKGVPTPRLEVYVEDGINYTSVFKHKESSVSKIEKTTRAKD